LAVETSSNDANSFGDPKSSFRTVTHTKTSPRSSVKVTKDLSNKNSNNMNNVRGNNSFDWNELQVAQNVTGMCGADKCFWRSSSDPESVGYLVASAGYHYRTMKKAYDFAVDVLDRKCHARHLFLEAPQMVSVTPSFVQTLNSLKHNDHAEFVDNLGIKGKKPRAVLKIFDEDDQHVVVQKVRVAPKPNLMFGYMARKWDMLVKDVPRFRSELQATGTRLRHIQEKLESERKGIECAMQYSDTYWYDLQGLIDLEGNYFHIDIDSQFWMEIADFESDNGKAVTNAIAYQRRQTLMGKFNEMIQRIVDPPPDGVSELSAWDDDESNSDGDDEYYD
jgi:hypothetical protein